MTSGLLKGRSRGPAGIPPRPADPSRQHERTIAFITKHATVAHILRHIGMPAQRPEPLAHSPPLQEELSYAS